jgi:enduracididine beta-hydroxylase
MHMQNIELSSRDCSAIDNLLSLVAVEQSSVEAPEFQFEATTYAHELPRTLRSGLNVFRLREPSSACAVSGFQVDDRRIGPTPASWKLNSSRQRTTREEIFFFLCASLIGDPIAWSTKQGGQVVHDIVPVREEADMQLASSSTTVLTYHTEDGFHPLRADYVGLMCLRNPENVSTTLAGVEDISLSRRDRDILAEPRFLILPDGSHLSSASTKDSHISGALWAKERERIRSMRDNPQRISLLFGDPEAPYLRLDQVYARAVPDDPEAAAALESLNASIERSLTKYCLRPGEIVFIDNYRAVHGRERFRARYDGRDRWLKRLNVTRDLRKSRDLRESPSSRLIAGQELS